MPARVAPAAVLVVERAERGRCPHIDSEPVVEHGLGLLDGHDGALAAECAHHVEQVVHRQVPPSASAHAGKIAGVPAVSLHGEGVGERVGCRMAERRARHAGRLEHVGANVLGVGLDSDVVPDQVVCACEERQLEARVRRDVAVDRRDQNPAEAEIHVLVPVLPEVGDAGGHLRSHERVVRG